MDIKVGDLVRVSQHPFKGYEWTTGAVGCIKGPAHERDFDTRSVPKKRRVAATPPIKPDWWIVSVDHSKAKGGYALAVLPTINLAPHACTSRCEAHRCQLG